MIKMESVIMGLLLCSVLLLLIILWRTEVTVRLLKKQIRAACTENMEGREKIALDNEEGGSEQMIDLLSGQSHIETEKQGVMEKMDMAGKVETETGNDEDIIKNTLQTDVTTASEELQEKEELINEVLAEIFC